MATARPFEGAVEWRVADFVGRRGLLQLEKHLDVFGVLRAAGVLFHGDDVVNRRDGYHGITDGHPARATERFIEWEWFLDEEIDLECVHLRMPQ
ncbi:MAG: hypothetical protein AABO58_18080 [Acidobacteriota bacterium]